MKELMKNKSLYKELIEYSKTDMYPLHMPGHKRQGKMLEGLDPYDIDIKLDADSKNRNAEIINALLKYMGLRLVFTKKLKVKKVLCKNILYKTVPNSEWQPRTNIREIIGNDDVIAKENSHHRWWQYGRSNCKRVDSFGQYSGKQHNSNASKS